MGSHAVNHRFSGPEVLYGDAIYRHCTLCGGLAFVRRASQADKDRLSGR